MSPCSVACLLTVLGACASQPRYIVTSTPLKVIDPAHPGLCIAIDPKDHKGIWWWDAGRSGCADRSSSMMAADRASVTRGTAGTLDASFQVGLMSGRNLQVRLEVFDGRIRDTISGLSVPAERRATLEVPERPPIGNRSAGENSRHHHRCWTPFAPTRLAGEAGLPFPFIRRASYRQAAAVRRRHLRPLPTSTAG